MSAIVRHVSNICYFHLKILKETANLSTYFKISNSFLILKSVSIITLIRNKWKHKSVTQPPACIIAFIQQESHMNILACIFSNAGRKANYWLSDFDKDSYLGSSKKPFLLLAESSLTFKQHIMHGISHVKGTPHNCRQPVVYENMARTVWKWSMISLSSKFAISRQKRTIKELKIT